MVGCVERKFVDYEGIKRLVCGNCGFRIASLPSCWWAAKFHIRRTGGYACPCCTHRTAWLRLEKAPKSVLEDTSWKTLFVGRNPEKFNKSGRLRSRYKRLYSSGPKCLRLVTGEVPEDLK